LVVDTEGFEPPGPWDAFDGRRPPDTRRDKGSTRREIHDLSGTNTQHRMHAGLDELGEMGIGTEAPIRHEHIPCF
jgi:hypothetical protein